MKTKATSTTRQKNRKPASKKKCAGRSTKEGNAETTGAETPADPKSFGRLITNPALAASITVGRLEPGASDHKNGVLKALEWHAENMEKGEFSQPVAMLSAQAATLDALFHNSVRLATAKRQPLPWAELLFKVALKAQAQSAKALQTIAELNRGSEKPVLIAAQQANVAGQQVVHNVVGTAPAGERGSEECIVRSAKNENPVDESHAALDERGTFETVPSYPEMETVGAVNRTADG